MTRRLTAVVVVLATAALLVTGCSAFERATQPATQHAADRTRAAAELDAPKTRHHPAPNRHAARNHCAHNTAAQRVLVSIRAQHVWLCARHRTALSTAVTTGATARRGDATPRGRFRIQGLNRNTVLYPASGGAYPVKFWIPFDAPLYGFHDASWQKLPYGSRHYVTRGSHGCIHMPHRAIKFLYHWARIGTRVVIR
ncbi:MAG TPA: L,D-transpeptidase [Jatrophihabitans sp.]|jgi:hypothetical protein|nr:L,D-transpeptidase [Jatrophihabitans sp.]